MILSIVPSPATIIGNFISPSPANIDLKNPEKTIKGRPRTIIDKYSQASTKIFPSAPSAIKISSPKYSPAIVKTTAMHAAIANACSALLSALALSSSPINRAIDAVTPDPNPIVKPSIKKKIGILKAIPAIASPPKRPINIISITL